MDEELYQINGAMRAENQCLDGLLKELNIPEKKAEEIKYCFCNFSSQSAIYREIEIKKKILAIFDNSNEGINLTMGDK